MTHSSKEYLDHSELVSIETVADWHEIMGIDQDCSDLRLSGYEIATFHCIHKLKQVLSRVSDFEELKKELTEFIEDREKFREYIDDKRDWETGHYQFNL
ncbi:MAG: hypothetical protein MUE81_15175 [Thermoflexibacter sp.]|nr:hypothetical protein [Thermoflexibacter sp.]